MTLVKLYLTVNFAVPQKLLQDFTTVNSSSVLQQFMVKTSEHNSVGTVAAALRRDGKYIMVTLRSGDDEL